VLLSTSCAESLSELLVGSSIIIGSLTVSPRASISIVAFSAVLDVLASMSSAAGGSFVGAFSVGPEGRLVFPYVSAVGNFLFTGTC